MEPVVYQESPLADYLKGNALLPVQNVPCGKLTVYPDGDGDDSDQGWAAADSASDRPASPQSDTSPPASPSPAFAPSGRPLVKQRFRSKLPDPLQQQNANVSPLRKLRRHYSVSAPMALYDFGRSEMLTESL